MVDWPHAPLHRFGESGLYFVTSGTYLKKHYYRDARSLDGLQQRLFALAVEHGVWLQAWALLSNHYHLVASVDGDGERLRVMLSRLHSLEAINCNRRDETPGRKVWYQFRDTLLTYERSWLARLRYTHENPVHHRLVPSATLYRWCSASWFARTARPAFVKAVASFKIDRLNVRDEFDPELPR